MAEKTKTRGRGRQAARKAEQAVETGRESMEDAVETGSAAAAESAERTIEAAREQVERAGAETFRAFDDAYSMGRENIDAMVRAGSIYMKGLEEINRELFSYSQRSFETGLANMKAMLGAKNLREFVDLNNEFTRKAFDNAIAETTRLSEITTQVTSEAARPLTERAERTARRMGKSAG